MKANGFTLIELAIMVIIIGVLAVFAIPKFISLQLDAKNTTLTGLGSAIKSSSSLIFNKAFVKTLHLEQAETVTVDGKVVAISYGYPLADVALWKDGYMLLDINHFKHSMSSDNLAVLFYFKERIPQPTTINDSCTVYYLAATSSSPATYGVNPCVE